MGRAGPQAGCVRPGRQPQQVLLVGGAGPPGVGTVCKGSHDLWCTDEAEKLHWKMQLGQAGWDVWVLRMHGLARLTESDRSKLMRIFTQILNVSNVAYSFFL